MTPAAPPLVPHVGVLALVPDRWDDLWQVRHHVLSRLAGYFPVVWMEPPPGVRERWARDGGGRPVRPRSRREAGLVVYTAPAWLPELYRPEWLARLALRRRLLGARRLLRSLGARRTVLYLWRPEFAEALRAIPHDLSCYHIDDDYAFSDQETPLHPTEARLLASADQVFIHSPGLLARKGMFNPHVTRVPNGVDYCAYAAARPEPPDLGAIARPRIGYTGFLKRQLDWPLLQALAAAHPRWSFVFVGPRSPHPELGPVLQELERLPNVYVLGPKSPAALPAYVQHFSVCIMPYRRTAYTDCIYPLKLHEYLASGLPIVATRIRSLEEFSTVVALGNTAEQWGGLIAGCLRSGAEPLQRARRQAVAQQHDWGRLVDRIARTMLDRLGESLPPLGPPARPVRAAAPGPQVETARP
jgi:glycosyltransferase involved in cell wall biosynthesis